MMEQFLGTENLQQAWQRVKSNAGAPGPAAAIWIRGRATRPAEPMTSQRTAGARRRAQ